MANKKQSIMAVLKVLMDYSDDDHYLTQQQIIDLIERDYGVRLERKSIASSLKILEEDMDYDINKKPRGGVAILSRQFDESEVKFLVDAIFSSKSIPGKQAKKLAQQVYSCLSVYGRKNFEYLVKSSDIVRTTNDVFYNIEVINEAMKRGKWIGFKYQTYDENGKPSLRYDGYVYHASPCYLINNFGRYYLLAYRYKYNSVSAWRLDYMKDVEVMEEREMIDPKTLDEFKDYKDITEYMNEHIYLFGSEPIEAEMALAEPGCLSYIYDWFGDKAKVRKQDGKLIAKVKCDKTAFFYWIMQYGEHFTLLSPKEMIDWVKKAADKIKEKYPD